MEQGNEMTVTKDLFRRVGVDEQKSESVVRPSISYWQDAVRRLKQNKVAMVSLVVLLLILVMCAIGPYIYPHPFDEQNIEFTNQAPSLQHWFGLDDLARYLRENLDGGKNLLNHWNCGGDRVACNWSAVWRNQRILRRSCG